MKSRIGKSMLFMSAILAPLSLQASLVITGDLQTEQGNPLDWDPPTSSLIMSDLGGGVYEYTVGNLAASTIYKFKILDDQGSGPANWGDPEISSNDAWIIGSSSGTATIRVTLSPGDGNLPAANRIGIMSSDWTPQLVGDFQSEAGGTDWTPSDPAFNMTNDGGGLFSYSALIDTAGTYFFKATDGSGWDRQLGANGFNNNADSYSFTTTAPNQTVNFSGDIASGYLSATVVPEASVALLGCLGLLGLLRRRRI